MKTQNTDAIIPNGSMMFAGTAYLSKPNGNEAVKIGSVVENERGALLLWLFSYPIKDQVVDLNLARDFGAETNEVGVVLDHVTCEPEFSIGEVKIAHTKAQMTMFGIPVFPATFLLRPPLETINGSLAASNTRRPNRVSA